jgi:hypothetical protein
MFKQLLDLFRIKPIDDSLLAKKVDSMPQPVNTQITDSVTQAAPSAQAEEIKKAVTKNTKPKKTEAKKPAAKPAPAKKKK